MQNKVVGVGINLTKASKCITFIKIEVYNYIGDLLGTLLILSVNSPFINFILLFIFNIILTSYILVFASCSLITTSCLLVPLS